MNGLIEEYKMVLCVRQDLNMSPGKIAAQCCHASLDLYRKSMDKAPMNIINWQQIGEKVVTLRLNSMEEWNNIVECAQAFELVYTEIIDAGRTEIEPNTRTVLGIGPAPSSAIDVITGHLKLL